MKTIPLADLRSKSIEVLTKRYGVSRNDVCALRAAAGVVVARGRPRRDDKAAEALALANETGASAYTIAEKLGISPGAAYRYLRAGEAVPARDTDQRRLEAILRAAGVSAAAYIECDAGAALARLSTVIARVMDAELHRVRSAGRAVAPAALGDDGVADGAGGGTGEGRLEHQRAEPDLDEHPGEVAAAVPELPGEADGAGEEAVTV